MPVHIEKISLPAGCDQVVSAFHLASVCPIGLSPFWMSRCNSPGNSSAGVAMDCPLRFWRSCGWSSPRASCSAVTHQRMDSLVSCWNNCFWCSKGVIFSHVITMTYQCQINMKCWWFIDWPSSHPIYTATRSQEWYPCIPPASETSCSLPSLLPQPTCQCEQQLHSWVLSRRAHP